MTAVKPPVSEFLPGSLALSQRERGIGRDLVYGDVVPDTYCSGGTGSEIQDSPLNTLFRSWRAFTRSRSVTSSILRCATSRREADDQAAVVRLIAYEVDEILVAAEVQELLGCVQPVAGLEVIDRAVRGVDEEADDVMTAVGHLADDVGEGFGFGIGVGLCRTCVLL